MEIMAERVDWEEALRRHRDGVLHTAVIEALDNEEAWAERHDLAIDSFALCGDLAEAYESFRLHLSPDARALTDPLLGILFGSWYETPNPGDVPNDLGEDPSSDSFYASLSPERVLSLANASDRFPEAQMDRAARACPEDVWEDCSYEEDFVPFVGQVRKLVERAAKDRRGILITVG